MDLICLHSPFSILLSSHRASQIVSCEGEHMLKSHLEKEEGCIFLPLKHKPLGHFSELRPLELQVGEAGINQHFTYKLLLYK